MHTNNKSVIITLATILVTAFFMPWVKYFVSLSAWDMLFGEAGQYIDTGFKYIAILIPISGVIIIYGAAFNNANYPIAKGLLFRLPIIIFIVLIIAIISKIGEAGGSFGSSDFENIIKIFGIGFWLTLIAAIVLPFLQSKAVSTKIPQTLTLNYSGKSKAGIALLVIGLILIIISTQNQFFTTTSRHRVDPGAKGLSDAFNIMGPMYDTQTYIDTKKKNAFLYSGIAALLIGGLLIASGRSTTNVVTSKSDNTTGESINENQTTPQTVPTSNYTRPQVNINLPKVNWDSTFAKSKKILNKYKVTLIISAGILIAFIVIYTLFIKADPVKDAKNLAKTFCACSEELNKNNIASLQTYSNEFGGKKFKSRTDARTSLNNILQVNQTKYDSCTKSANMKYTERLADYNAKGGQNAYTFQETYNSISNACTNTNSSDVVAMQSQIEEKIKGIIDPEPDIEKIKADLIGREVIGWRFAYLNEFKEAQILNTSKSSDRIEYQVKFNLIDNTTGSGEHDCEVMLIYLQNDNGWYLDGVNLNYIVYTNTFYPDRYIQITPFPNTKWNAENNYKMVWKTSTWEYAEETVTGPDMGATLLPNSTTYFIKSLEPKEIKVKFTYRPNN